MVKKVLPAYFRSQRQIIIDAEALLKQQRKLAAESVPQRSDTIGVDQRILRLRYGQFLGEEAEGEPQAAADQRCKDTTGRARSRLLTTTRSCAAVMRQQASPAFGQESSPSSNNSATPTITRRRRRCSIRKPAPRSRPRSTRCGSRNCNLRQGHPDAALPYAYRALTFIKQVQQATAHLPGAGRTGTAADRREPASGRRPRRLPARRRCARDGHRGRSHARRVVAALDEVPSISAGGRACHSTSPRWSAGCAPTRRNWPIRWPSSPPSRPCARIRLRAVPPRPARAVVAAAAAARSDGPASRRRWRCRPSLSRCPASGGGAMTALAFGAHESISALPIAALLAVAAALPIARLLYRQWRAEPAQRSRRGALPCWCWNRCAPRCCISHCCHRPRRAKPARWCGRAGATAAQLAGKAGDAVRRPARQACALPASSVCPISPLRCATFGAPNVCASSGAGLEDRDR